MQGPDSLSQDSHLVLHVAGDEGQGLTVCLIPGKILQGFSIFVPDGEINTISCNQDFDSFLLVMLVGKYNRSVSCCALDVQVNPRYCKESLQTLHTIVIHCIMQCSLSSSCCFTVHF